MISADEFAAAVQSVSPRHGRAVAQLAVRQGARWDQVQEIKLDGPDAPEITVQGEDGRRWSVSARNLDPRPDFR